MRHVDDGTIHAWLDDQITDPGEAAWIEEHLQWCAACGARVAEERAMLEQAHALLAVAAPASEPPAFHELMAKAGNTVADSEAASVAEPAHGRRWLLQAGWAASVALAIGIGWTAREIADREPLRSSAAPPAEERAVAGTSEPTDSEAARRAEQSRSTSRTTVASNAPDDRQAAQLPLRERAVAATAPREERRPGVPGDRVSTQRVAAAPQPPVDGPRVQAAAPEPDGIGNVRSAAAPQALVPPAAVPARMSPPPVPERATLAVEASARALLTAQETEWRTLPRTEAAARSGMPLYGIDGLELMLTAISLDNRVVRTIYRLESGDTVELEQARPMPEGARPVTTVQTGAVQAGSALTARGGGLAADIASAAQRVWSGARGDVRMTLRTASAAADLNALGAKLRID